ncbi:hypothetical protein MTR67_042895 [Solanum verrucosum]|uniref:Uncharacterized protein n=1 Tax=Solanum verrucosum TaxID=315347 RepID=A0AAF0UN65_SOLVR|nr:hypothetical protein MTR67_042895 [Solanum verrucosum]
MGPAADSKKRKVDKEWTREKRVSILKTQKVLNGKGHVNVLYEQEMRMFYYNVEFTKDGSLNIQVNDIIIHLNEDILGEILKVPGKESRQL